ncbi:MAG: translation elongation factor Ts [Actinobacteria bacterium]|nr:translation elongation factor Ts [Actinomycetota bacterium]MCL5883349.1 translation elongation factor Ts [Actinomycetota bacterium]
MAVSAKEVKALREQTGAGMMDCKKALSECSGDFDEAVKMLRTKGLADVAKRSGRTANEGLVDSYIHAGGKIGVLVEVNSETDFVARNDDFKAFVHDIAMHIAAAAPRYISRDDVPPLIVDEELAIYKEQARATGKPDNILEKIATGKLNKFYEQVCLLEQPFVKDDQFTVEQLLGNIVGKIGENIVIKRFARFELGKES